MVKVVITKRCAFLLSHKAIVELVKMGSELVKKVPMEKFLKYEEGDEKYIENCGDGFIRHRQIDNAVFKDGYAYYLELYDPSIRTHPDLIAIVEKLGEEANTEYSELKIVEVPDDVEWYIAENDQGQEWVAEKHRTWG